MLIKRIKIIWLSLFLTFCMMMLPAGYAVADETHQLTQDPGTQLSEAPEDPEDKEEPGDKDESGNEKKSEDGNESGDEEKSEDEKVSGDKEESEDEKGSEDEEGAGSEEKSEEKKEPGDDEESGDKEESGDEEEPEDDEESGDKDESEDDEESESKEGSGEESDEDEDSDDQEETISGIVVDAGEGDVIHIFVTEDISVEGDESTTIDAEGKEKGAFEIRVTGSVFAEGEDAEAIDTEADSKAAGLICVGGNVEANGEESSALDAKAADGGTVDIYVAGSVKAEGEEAQAISAETEDDGKIFIYVTGDVMGTSAGLAVSAEDEEGTIHVTVGGTIIGGEEPILVSGDGIEESLDLIVWKIELDEDGNAVLEKTAGDEDPEKTDLSEAIEKKIRYIIKYDQPVGGWIDLAGTTWAGGYNVANEGDTVVMKISVKPGYVLLAAYNGLGEKATLYQDSDGNYYAVVPKGGGVYLTADLVYIGIPVIPVKAKIPFYIGTMKQAEHLLGFVAQEEQFFYEKGLDSKIILFEDEAAMAEALEKGQIGAAFMETSAAVSLQKNNHDLIIFGGARADESLETEESICIVAYTPTFLGNPKTYKAFEEAILKAFDYYQKNHEKMILDIQKYTEESEELIEQAIYSEDSFISPDPDLLGIEETENVKFDDSLYNRVISH